MTYRRFAQNHGISPQWLCNILKGEKPSYELAKKLGKTVGRPPGVFMGPPEKRRAVVAQYIRNND